MQQCQGVVEGAEQPRQVLAIVVQAEGDPARPGQAEAVQQRLGAVVAMADGNALFGEQLCQIAAMHAVDDEAGQGALWYAEQAQRRAFERQLQIAVDTGKPLFLHQRDAHDDFVAMMKNFDGQLGPAVVHCFTGTRKELFDCLDQDWHIGITGWLCDERRGLHLRELVKNIPANRLMIETDAPYLLPRTVKPQPSHRRNEPMYLAHIVAELARDRGEEVEVTAAATTATARAFFGLPVDR